MFEHPPAKPKAREAWYANRTALPEKQLVLPSYPNLQAVSDNHSLKLWNRDLPGLYKPIKPLFVTFKIIDDPTPKVGMTVKHPYWPKDYKEFQFGIESGLWYQSMLSNGYLMKGLPSVPLIPYSYIVKLQKEYNQAEINKPTPILDWYANHCQYSKSVPPNPEF